MSSELEVNAAEAEEKQDALEGGSYEVIKNRLDGAAKALTAKADQLNELRKATFGGTELEVAGNERVRTENNCVPRDIVNVGGKLLFGFNVYIGLKTETAVGDVFSLHNFDEEDGGFDLSELSPDSVTGLLDDPEFQTDFAELYKYYKGAKLLHVGRSGQRLIAVFQIGRTLADIKAFRWALDPNGSPTYIDNRGDEDHVFPASHDFEWVLTTREDHVRGRFPHISILDEVFVETVGGDLTVKIEDNTEDGQGIYREPVEDPRQALDDADIWYAKVGALILIKILPYQETDWRHFIFNTRTKDVRRADAIGQACIQLPEDHGVVFPGGYYLQTGDMKIFDAAIDDLRFQKAVKSPNGEDVLYVFYHELDGHYLLLPYNLIRKDVQNPIPCHGFTLFDDGRMLVFRSTSDDPTRVHPMQIWSTPFTSEIFAAAKPTDGSLLAKIGNAELVRGISDAYSVVRLISTESPNRLTFEDLVSSSARMIDNYYWVDAKEVGDLAEGLKEIKQNAELIIDEFEKVQTLKQRAGQALAEARESQMDVIRELRPSDWRAVEQFLVAMTDLRRQRGHLITLRDVRYIDLTALEALEQEAIDAFDDVSKHCVEFLLAGEAFEPLAEKIEELLAKIEGIEKANQIVPLAEELEKLTEGLNLLSEVISGLQIDDTTKRTTILESISEVFGHLNRVRATLTSQKKALLSKEGKAEFAAQFKLLGQSVSSAIAMADTPERCDEQLSRLMIQLEELEGRFSEFDEFLAELTVKREEIYEALEAKKQQLIDAKQRRAQNILAASERILQGINRRVRSFKEDDELNAYFASDAMILKLRQLVEQLHDLGDSVKADDVDARLKAAKRDAIRNLKDQQDLFEGGGDVIKLGKHRFNINTQPFELTMVPRGDEMALHLTGTDFYETIDDDGFQDTKEFWSQGLVSESPDVYRGEYLASCMLKDAELGEQGLSIGKLTEIAHDEAALVEVVRTYAADRYDEGYERGLHDADTAKILEKLLGLRNSAGLLRYPPRARAIACVFWAFDDADHKDALHRRAMSLGRLRAAFTHPAAEEILAADLAAAIVDFSTKWKIEASTSDAEMAGRYLLEELVAERPRFETSIDAIQLREALVRHLDVAGERNVFEADLKTLETRVGERLALAHAWVEAFVKVQEGADQKSHAVWETAALVATGDRLDRQESAARVDAAVEGLLGDHRRIVDRTMRIRLDEFLGRLNGFMNQRVPAFLAFRAQRTEIVEREKHRLRIDEFKPRVLTSFVRNKLINDVYLPIIGDNLAKQLGAAGEKKRTDLMGMLLLISPPGYGKTTLMEYMASRLGMVFMKVNGPALGHGVVSLDPSEAPNATSRQEVEKINLAFEMANNVMLYLDDIQHTHPELLQKFISLCDGQRRVEGVWKGRTRTYDLRGKKFCVVMAGNPYTESGDKFQIPDMLANRADTYNLGDILDGKDDVFALSYVENALTSNPVLGPIASRSLEDVHRFIRVSHGEDVPQTDFEHSYSGVEVEETTNVLKRMFKARDVLLAVNQQYIASASQDDNYRTEPPFKLQGSYRNMNKLAEKIVSAMNEQELQALVTDHYLGESQTLTTGAEQNLLKLAEMRGVMTDDEEARWAAIKKDFRRVQVQGGGEDDPVSRVTSTLGALGDHLDGIRSQLFEAVAAAKTKTEDKRDDAWVETHMGRLDEAITALTNPKLEVAVRTEAPTEIGKSLETQMTGLREVLLPLVRNSAQNLEEVRAITEPLSELIELMKLNQLSSANGQRSPQPMSSTKPEPRKAAPKKAPARKATPKKKAGKARRTSEDSTAPSAPARTRPPRKS